MKSDLAFYRRRLAEELARAETESTEALRRLHREWAELYRARLRDIGDLVFTIAA
jgi:hypothetical protein